MIFKIWEGESTSLLFNINENDIYYFLPYIFFLSFTNINKFQNFFEIPIKNIGPNSYTKFKIGLFSNILLKNANLGHSLHKMGLFLFFGKCHINVFIVLNYHYNIVIEALFSFMISILGIVKYVKKN